MHPLYAYRPPDLELRPLGWLRKSAVRGARHLIPQGHQHLPKKQAKEEFFFKPGKSRHVSGRWDGTQARGPSFETRTTRTARAATTTATSTTTFRTTKKATAATIVAELTAPAPASTTKTVRKTKTGKRRATNQQRHHRQPHPPPPTTPPPSTTSNARSPGPAPTRLFDAVIPVPLRQHLQLVPEHLAASLIHAAHVELAHEPYHRATVRIFLPAVYPQRVQPSLVLRLFPVR